MKTDCLDLHLGIKSLENRLLILASWIESLENNLFRSLLISKKSNTSGSPDIVYTISYKKLKLASWTESLENRLFYDLHLGFAVF